ncbi:hypothetical protein [Paenibacillus soyae]|uniref:Uncharacterized protein n=1 Tax=Paenibacillus soyae TaxID=2969249 RepID=A0A9X2SAQ1_9BACL|nr:hypothetical protein [Paenibacillus soyae]MCR2804848.1 hypothetical protein [Paenibacillus soyae]
MIVQVSTEKEKALFDSIWMKVWDEKGFEHEHADGDCFLFYADGKAAGTVQFVPYRNEDGGDWQRVLNPDAADRLRRYPGQVFMIDKFAIVKAYRSSSLLDMLMFSLFEYAEKGNQLYAIALLDPLLYRLIRFQYHFKVEKIGARAMYKGAEVIPILMDSRYFLSRKAEFGWYRETAAALSRY